MRDVLLTMLGAVLGALLGSLGTVAVFGARLARIEEHQSGTDKDVKEVSIEAKKASKDASRAWEAIRAMEGFNKGRTGEVPRWSPRDSGEGPSRG